MMIKKTLILALSMAVLTPTLPTVTADQPAPTAPRMVPGITAKDAFPHGCVDCHVKRPDGDQRISVLMKAWSEKVDSKFLAEAQKYAPKGMTLKGKHPAAAASLKDIPAACLKCHSKTSKIAPPLSTMLHGFHLTGGSDNDFLTKFQGECTHCHKLNAARGEWSMPSGPEK